MSLVFDCTVLIDLREGGVLPHAQRLPHQLFVCDVNADELRQKPKKRWPRHLRDAGIQVQELPSEGMVLLLTLAERHQRPSRKDLFALALAISLDATLVTGDRHLRKAADAERCPVHGTLWLLDEMVRHRILKGPAALAALERMLAADRRIPKRQAEKYQYAWQTNRPLHS